MGKLSGASGAPEKIFEQTEVERAQHMLPLLLTFCQPTTTVHSCAVGTKGVRNVEAFVSSSASPSQHAKA